MAVTKVTTKVIADDAVTIDKINDSALVTEAEGISSNDNDTTVPTSAAVKDFVDTSIAALVDSAPATLDTLNELAAALGDDANFSTTITNSIATKQDASTALTTSTSFGGDVSGTYNSIIITDDSHNHIISNVDGLQTALNAKQDTLTAGTNITISGSTINSTDTNTTYSISAVDSGDNAIIRLTDSNATTDDITLAAGNNITLTPVGDTITIASTASGSVTEAFKTISVAGQSDVVADGATDTLTFAAGSNITLTTDAATDTITIASTASGGGGNGSVYVVTDQFTGDGSTTAFTLSDSVTDSDAVQIYLNGVYQNKSAGNYSISGTTLTFVTAPTNTTEVEAVHFVSTAATSLAAKQFTGDGSTVAFDLVDTVSDEKYTFVFIQGVYQEKSTYSVSGSTLTFSTAPQSGYTVEVMVFGTSVSTGGGISWDTTVKTSAFTAVSGKGYFVNTTSAAITVTLPSSPSAGDEVTIVDYAGTADTNNITITSSDNINGASDDVTINYERGGVSMVYVDATQGWIAYNAANETATAFGSPLPSSFSADYLVVAGGGAGGYGYGGGGGAGGLRTSYGNTSGGGAAAESSLTLATATNYTVTVGGGGAYSSVSNINPTNWSGSASSFSTISTVGGGGGADDIFWNNNSIGGATGGSGGGGAVPASGSVTAGSGTTNQGYAGGVGSRLHAGGGGGAAGIGEAGGVDGTNYGGDGGNGLAVNILSTTNATAASVGQVSGGDTFFAGGGGGLGWAAAGSGGIGGGGNGTYLSNTNGTAGAANSGGGGGGGQGSNYPGGSGGAGVVILRYPSGYNITVGAGITQASGSPFTEGTDKVSVFTAGTGTISFS
jgi:hypothetical protein